MVYDGKDMKLDSTWELMGYNYKKDDPITKLQGFDFGPVQSMGGFL